MTLFLQGDSYHYVSRRLEVMLESSLFPKSNYHQTHSYHLFFTLFQKVNEVVASPKMKSKASKSWEILVRPFGLCMYVVCEKDMQNVMFELVRNTS